MIKTYKDIIPGYYAEWNSDTYVLEIYKNRYPKFIARYEFVLNEDMAFEKMQKFYKESKELKLIK